MTENTDYMKHFFEIFENMKRPGPGSEASTLRAFRSLPESSNIRTIMDIGCGKGSASLILAAECDARITAVDNHPPFLDFLIKEAKKQGYGEQITATCGSMSELGFQDGSFDLLWAEGSAYIMGFEKALSQWRRLIRDGGFLFVSDAVLLTDQPSPECAEFWNAEYPDITAPDSRRRQADSLGYDLITSYLLPCADWISFYSDMQRQVDAAISKYGMAPAFEDMRKEIRISELYGNEYGYICLLLRKR